MHCPHHPRPLQQPVPVLEIHLRPAPAECVHFLLPLHELLHAELQEVQGSAAAAATESANGLVPQGGQQQQQHDGSAGPETES